MPYVTRPAHRLRDGVLRDILFRDATRGRRSFGRYNESPSLVGFDGNEIYAAETVDGVAQTATSFPANQTYYRYPARLAHTGQFSIFARFRFTAALTRFDYLFDWGYPLTSVGGYALRLQDAANVLNLQVSGSSNFAGTVLGTSIAPDEDYILTVSARVSGGAVTSVSYLTRNGVLEARRAATFGSGIGLPSAAQACAVNNDYNTSSVNNAGPVLMRRLTLWDRLLTDGEQLALHRDPRVLDESPRRTYFIPAAAGGTAEGLFTGTGIGTGDAVGYTIFEAEFSASGLFSSAVTGHIVAEGVFAESGIGTGGFVGEAPVVAAEGFFDGAGIGTGEFEGYVVAEATFTVNGVGTSAYIGYAAAEGVFDEAGIGSGEFTGETPAITGEGVFAGSGIGTGGYTGYRMSAGSMLGRGFGFGRMFAFVTPQAQLPPADELDLTPPETVLDHDTQLWLVENFMRVQKLLAEAGADAELLFLRPTPIIKRVVFATSSVDDVTNSTSYVNTSLSGSIQVDSATDRVMALFSGAVITRHDGAGANTSNRLGTFRLLRTTPSDTTLATVTVGRQKDASDTNARHTRDSAVILGFDTPGSVATHTYRVQFQSNDADHEAVLMGSQQANLMLVALAA